MSVVVTTFRRPELLRRALNSVLNQSRPPEEVIVVDDGADDITAEVVAGFQSSLCRYITYGRPRGGAGARNAGARAATRELIAFLDDDDVWLPRKLERQCERLGEAEAALCGYRYLGSSRERVLPRTRITVQDLTLRNTHPTSVLVVRRDVLLEVPFDEELPNGQDWDLLLRLASRRPLTYVSEVLCELDDGSHQRITNAKLEAKDERRLAVVHKHRACLGDYGSRYATADVLSAYITSRPDKLRRIWDLVVRVGLLPVLHVATYRVSEYFRAFLRSTMWQSR